MAEITIEKYAGKMNRAGYDAFIQAMRQARIGTEPLSVDLCPLAVSRGIEPELPISLITLQAK